MTKIKLMEKLLRMGKLMVRDLFGRIIRRILHHLRLILKKMERIIQSIFLINWKIKNLRTILQGRSQGAEASPLKIRESGELGQFSPTTSKIQRIFAYGAEFASKSQKLSAHTMLALPEIDHLATPLPSYKN